MWKNDDPYRMDEQYQNELKKKVQIEQQNMNSMLHCYLIYHNLANQIFQRKIWTLTWVSRSKESLDTNLEEKLWELSLFLTTPFFSFIHFFITCITTITLLPPSLPSSSCPSFSPSWGPSSSCSGWSPSSPWLSYSGSTLQHSGLSSH